MGSRLIKIASMFFVCILLIISSSTAQDIDHKRHIEVSLRMIAHQVLLSSGDSTSRVLPVIKENDRYRIQFESDFEFMPGELVSTIDRVVKETKLANRYILEVEKCQTAEMIYSFEMNETQKMDIIPCKGRSQPKSCYSLFFTLIEPGWIDSINLANSSSADTNQLIYIIIIGLIVLMIVVFFIMKRRSRKPEIDPNMIPLGAYHFDKRNTELLIDHQRIDLSGKESDLLLLLYNAVNTTVEREVILNMVWGDEGDYVGRTLDVFISKLRKKLEFDSKVKIVNIRGVGYKLVMDV